MIASVQFPVPATNLEVVVGFGLFVTKTTSRRRRKIWGTKPGDP